MDDVILEQVLSCMKLYDDDTSVQKVQTAHRIKLAEFWDIQEGDKVLEIGCGQGDTTAVLAHLVGDQGMVYGIDIASPDYGNPITLGDAAAHLQKSRLGKQIDIQFGVDVLSPEVDFPDDHFDKIVLSHCSWYFKSFDELAGVLQKVKRWGRKLCFAEWDSRITTIEQYPHFLAILIQSQYECFKENSLSNIRTLFTPQDIKEIAEASGWHVLNENSINSKGLQDGRWEIDMTLTEYLAELDKLTHIPEKFKLHLHSEVKLLQASVENAEDIQSMSTFAFIAE
jgi:ubiquinone/menaquinone biosynthesis C-methylase UbiE